MVIGTSSTTSTPAEIAASFSRLCTTSDADEDTAGAIGRLRGSAPNIADRARGGDMVPARPSARSASMVPKPDPLRLPRLGRYFVPLVSAWLTCPTVKLGNSDLTRAATPATIALAAQVLF